MNKPSLNTAIAILVKHGLITVNVISSLVSDDVLDYLSDVTKIDESPYFEKQFLDLSDSLELQHIASDIVSKQLKKIKELKKNLDFIRSTDIDAIFAPSSWSDIHQESMEAQQHTFHFDLEPLRSIYPYGIDGNSFNLIAAPPNAGKTTFMIALALDCIKNKQKIHFCSFEESAAAIRFRFIQQFYGENISECRTREKLQNLAELEDLFNKYITLRCFNSTVDVDDYFVYLTKHQPDVVFCDYFQHFEPDENHEQHINYKRFANKISRWVKKKDRYVPFFSGVQMAKFGVINPEDIQSGKFMASLEHIGGSYGAVQLADNIINLYRYRLIDDLPPDSEGIAVYCVKSRSYSRKFVKFNAGLSIKNQRVITCDNTAALLGTNNISKPAEPDKPDAEHKITSKKTRNKNQSLLMDADEDPTKTITQAVQTARGII